jgi:aerobic-type carbon monoxide dehydrogenase small subunit (CoxS/CutS family)
VMSMKGLLLDQPNPTDAQILHAMSGNLCRCGAYQHILEAGRLAKEQVARSR